MRKIDNGYLFDSTGREFYANGYIGAMESFEGSVDIAQGYDGYVNVEIEDGDIEDLSVTEKLELADYMIKLWTLYKIAYLPI